VGHITTQAECYLGTVPNEQADWWRRLRNSEFTENLEEFDGEVDAHPPDIINDIMSCGIGAAEFMKAVVSIVISPLDRNIDELKPGGESNIDIHLGDEEDLDCMVAVLQYYHEAFPQQPPSTLTWVNSGGDISAGAIAINAVDYKSANTTDLAAQLLTELTLAAKDRKVRHANKISSE
jgi:hypothetical protein